jgi:hypothetical protein
VAGEDSGGAGAAEAGGVIEGHGAARVGWVVAECGLDLCQQIDPAGAGGGLPLFNGSGDVFSLGDAGAAGCDRAAGRNGLRRCCINDHGRPNLDRPESRCVPLTPAAGEMTRPAAIAPPENCHAGIFLATAQNFRTGREGRPPDRIHSHARRVTGSASQAARDHQAGEATRGGRNRFARRQKSSMIMPVVSGHHSPPIPSRDGDRDREA